MDIALKAAHFRAWSAPFLPQLAMLSLIGGLAASSPALSEEEDGLLDPLETPEPTPLNRSGYVSGGSVPPSLQRSDGFRLGDFALTSRASFSALYDDNVEADDAERDEDVFLIFAPAVRAQSTYARHSIGFGAAGSMGTALKDSADDFFDWRIGADGRIDLSRKSRIDAAVGYSLDEEDDEDVDSEDGDGDVPVHSIDARLGYSVQGDRMGFGVGSTVSRLDVGDSDFDDRDRTTFGLNGRVRYRWSENLTLSSGPNYRRSVFDDEADDGDLRDAHEVGFRVGAGYRASRTIVTRASLGYALIDFDDPDRKNEDRATGSAGLTFAPGGGTTLDLQASRTLGFSIEDGEDSRTTTRGAVKLAHRLELGSRSALSSSFTATISRFSDLDRTDRNLVAGLTYAYRLSEHAFATASYRFSQRFSDDEGADFYRNLISAGVTLSY